MAKSAALASSLLGKEALQQRSFILAHGSSTPQNRVTESLIYHKIAQTFAIDNWKITAPKAYVGHTIAPASGDQLAIALGVFSHNIMPGITTIDKVADDVYADHLDIRNNHYECADMDIAFINSKGFGGNNATATVLSAKITLQMLAKRHGDAVMSSYSDKNISIKAAQQSYKEQADLGQYALIYRFGDGLIDDNNIVIDEQSIHLPGFEKAIMFSTTNSYQDMF
jgi:acetoacetyl-[acyl-carrier protein] synthase